MFGWFKQKPEGTQTDDVVATQPHGEIFPWPKGVVLTAVDEVVLALPVALFEEGRPMCEFVFGSEDMELNIPKGSEVFFIRLGPGMSVRLAKSVQAYVVSEDGKPRRIRVRPESRVRD